MLNLHKFATIKLFDIVFFVVYNSTVRKITVGAQAIFKAAAALLTSYHPIAHGNLEGVF